MNDLLIEDMGKLEELIRDTELLEQNAQKLHIDMLRLVEFADTFWHDEYFSAFKKDWQKNAGDVLECQENIVDHKNDLIAFFEKHK